MSRKTNRRTLASPRRGVRHQALVAIAAFVVGATAGCGGAGEEASTEEFEQQVRMARQQVETTIDDVTDARSQQELSDELAAGADELRATADDLEETEAPDEARDEKEELVDGLRDFADRLEQASSAASEGELRSFVRGLGEEEEQALEQIQRALEDLEEQGIGRSG